MSPNALDNNNMNDPLHPRAIWIAVDEEEIIEIKRIKMDHDKAAAVAFFREVLLPRVKESLSALHQLVGANTHE